jgi:hypothetical protein
VLEHLHRSATRTHLGVSHGCRHPKHQPFPSATNDGKHTKKRENKRIRTPLSTFYIRAIRTQQRPTTRTDRSVSILILQGSLDGGGEAGRQDFARSCFKRVMVARRTTDQNEPAGHTNITICARQQPWRVCVFHPTHGWTGGPPPTGECQSGWSFLLATRHRLLFLIGETRRPAVFRH